MTLEEAKTKLRWLGYVEPFTTEALAAAGWTPTNPLADFQPAAATDPAAIRAEIARAYEELKAGQQAGQFAATIGAILSRLLLLV